MNTNLNYYIHSISDLKNFEIVLKKYLIRDLINIIIHFFKEKDTNYEILYCHDHKEGFIIEVNRLDYNYYNCPEQFIIFDFITNLFFQK